MFFTFCFRAPPGLFGEFDATKIGQEVFTAQVLGEVFLKKFPPQPQIPDNQTNKKPGYLATAGLLGEN